MMQLIERTDVGELASALFAGAAASGFIDDPIRLWAKLGDVGLSDLTAPLDRGGSGGTHAQAFDFLRAAGHAGAAGPLVEHDLVGNWLRTHAAVDVPAGASTVALLAADDAVVRRIPWAGDAVSVLLVRTDGATSSLAQVPLAAAAVRRGENLAGESRDAVAIEANVLSDADWVPIEVARPVDQLIRLRGSAGRLAMSAGAAVRAVELVTEHVTSREQFGQPLVRFQAVEHALSTMVADVVLLQTVARSALLVWDRDDGGVALPVHAGRAVAGDLVDRVCRTAHQLLGAMGTTQEHDLHRSTTRLWAWRDEFGRPRDHAMAVGDLVGDAGDPWEVITAPSAVL